MEADTLRMESNENTEAGKSSMGYHFSVKNLDVDLARQAEHIDLRPRLQGNYLLWESQTRKRLIMLSAMNHHFGMKQDIYDWCKRDIAYSEECFGFPHSKVANRKKRTPVVMEGDKHRSVSDEKAEAEKNANDNYFKPWYYPQSFPNRTKSKSVLLKTSNLSSPLSIGTPGDFVTQHSEPSDVKEKKVMTEPNINNSGKTVVGRSVTGSRISDSRTFQPLTNRTNSMYVLENSCMFGRNLGIGILHSEPTTTNAKHPLGDESRLAGSKRPRAGKCAFDNTMLEEERLPYCNYFQPFRHRLTFPEANISAYERPVGFETLYSDLITSNKEKPVTMKQDESRLAGSKRPRAGKCAFDNTMLEEERLPYCSNFQPFLHRPTLDVTSAYESPMGFETLYSELTTSNKEKPVTMELDTIRVVLLGKAGSGKSALGNTLLAEKRFPKLRNLQVRIDRPESRSVEEENSRFGRHINIVDTPGIFNTDLTELQVANAIRKCILLTEPGPHAIILVIKASRLTKEDIEVFKTYTEMFGESMFKYTVVVFTHFDHWKQIKGKTKEEAIEDFVRSFPETLNNVIQKIKNRYIMLDTKGTDVENETKALIFGIEQMVKDNKNRFYSYEHLIDSNTTQLRAERMGADENRRQKKRKNGRQLTRSFIQKNIKRARSSFERETDASMIPHFKRSYNGRA